VQNPIGSPERHARILSALYVAVLLVLTEIVFMRPGFLTGGKALLGIDYDQMHIRRIIFARDALFGPLHTLPAWYPREMLGAPFAANVQSFPWIPTRLLLFLFDPTAAYAPAIAIAAALSAVFAWLFCRRMGLSRIASVTAAWTFACAGFFSSRVMAGHLPLLEAYPALPLLLWLTDRALEKKRRLDLVWLAVACACVVSAGHPQIPAYSVAAALFYAAWKVRGRSLAQITAVIVLGCGLTLALWWPMLSLIGRSTRILHLAAPDNDLSLPWGRVLALVVPGIDGWQDPIDLAKQHPFEGYPTYAYFWDTASYIGILPLVAIVAFMIGCLSRMQLPGPRWRFLTLLGVGSFLLSLPLAAPLLHLLPGTLLRSPARLLYLSTFCVSVALGAAVDVLLRRNQTLLNALVIVLLGAHFADLNRFDRHFVQEFPRGRPALPFDATVSRETGDARIAEERDEDLLWYEDRFDDAGGFDSILLADYYRAVHALAGEPPDLNEQVIEASELPVHALEATGVRFVMTSQTRTDLEAAGRSGPAILYRVKNPAPRAEFFGNGSLTYSRPSSDEIVLTTAANEAGFARVLETFDPGWSATLDGAWTPLTPWNGFALSVAVPAGHHTVRLTYRTPGRTTGEILSLLSLGGLIFLVFKASH
jgi:hypothetical protein